MVAGSVTGCGGDEPTTSDGADSSSKSDLPTFALGEWVVELDRPSIPHGKVTLVADNVGGETHELVLVRADAVADLPTKPDGSVDEERIAEADMIGEVEDIPSADSRSTSFDLTPGTYVAFCNVVDEMGMGNMGGADTASTMMGNGSGGHVHFALGMSQLVTVE